VYFLQCAFTQLGIFEGAGNKTTIPNLSQNRLAALEVPRPEKSEQEAVVKTLALVRDAVQRHRQAADLLDALFKSLLHKLMTGEICVSDLDLSALPAPKPAPQEAPA
jgi:type I restriction enzyme S subunit